MISFSRSLAQIAQGCMKSAFSFASARDYSKERTVEKLQAEYARNVGVLVFIEVVVRSMNKDDE